MEELYNVDETADLEVEDAKSDVTDEPLCEEASEESPESEATDKDAGVDYEALIASDLEKLRAEFPELRGINDITDLNNPLRYAALRDLGLTPEEAYMATAKRRVSDTRSHLRSAHGKGAVTSMGMMSQYELATARELFPGMSDSELQRLYKKVTK